MVDRIRAAGYVASVTPRAVRFSGARWEAFAPVSELSAGQIRPACRVDALEVGGDGRIVLHAFDGRPDLIVDRLVLAAGLFENTRLVTELTGSTQSRHIRDHSATGFLWFLPGQPHGQRDASVYAGYHPQATSNLFIESQPVDGGTLVDAWAMGEQSAEAASVLLAASVVLPTEAAALMSALGAAQRDTLDLLADRVGAGRVVWGARSFKEASALARERPDTPIGYLAGLGELDHESGGLTLGGAEVDDHGRLRAVDGIFVVGPCTFPRADATNPTLTTLALARHVARAVAGMSPPY